MIMKTYIQPTTKVNIINAASMICASESLPVGPNGLVDPIAQGKVRSDASWVVLEGEEW